MPASLYQALLAYMLVIACITEAVFTKPSETWRSQTSVVNQGLGQLLTLTLRRVTSFILELKLNKHLTMSVSKQRR